MTISAIRDANRIPVLLATLNTDGVTPVAVTVGAVTHGLSISDGTTGSGTSSTNAERDANRVPVVWGVSSADGITPVAIWCNASGQLLTKST